MKTTIKDIAQVLGVSHTTVSRALLNRPDISEAMKEKVRKVAAELHYQTNDLARSLVSNKSNIIGLIIPDIEDPHYGSICRQLSLVLEETHYSLFIRNSERDMEKDLKCLASLIRQRVDGYIIASPFVATKEYADFLAQKYPTILLDFHGKSLKVDSVMGDNFQGAVYAVDHLYNLGYRKIAHLKGFDNGIPSQERFRGYMDAVQRKNLVLKNCPIVGNNSTFEGGLQAAEELHKKHKLPEAIFAVNDVVAFGAMQYFHRAGIRIPDDVAIVGFDDVRVAKMMPVPLTTIRLSTRDIARTAWAHLMEQINGERKNSKVKNVFVKPELMVRESCGSTRKSSPRFP